MTLVLTAAASLDNTTPGYQLASNSHGLFHTVCITVMYHRHTEVTLCSVMMEACPPAFSSILISIFIWQWYVDFLSCICMQLCYFPSSVDGLNNTKDLRQWKKWCVMRGLFLLIYHCIPNIIGVIEDLDCMSVCTNVCMLWVCAFEISKLTILLWSQSILITASICSNHSIKTVCKNVIDRTSIFAEQLQKLARTTWVFII